MTLSEILERRFQAHPDRHPDLPWETVARRLAGCSQALNVLQKMEDTGGGRIGNHFCEAALPGQLAAVMLFLLTTAKQFRQSATCRTVEQGVARPIWNMETGDSRLIRNATGTRTRNAPIIPCAMTNFVFPVPLKKPMKQNKKQVSRQSIAYAFR